jgi:repressor LexA
MKTTITDRQREIYEFIRASIDTRGIPPTMREIGKAFGIRSTNGVEKHLAVLEQSGFVMRERGKSRGIFLHADGKRPLATVPVLGRVAAGMPVLSPENHEGEVTVDISLFSLRSTHNLFALKVKGESMIDAHIVDGDTLIVRVQSAVQSGDIVVALVNGEATVKRLFVEKDRVRLQPENSAMKPLYPDRGDFRIIGRVVGVLRRI